MLASDVLSGDPVADAVAPDVELASVEVASVLELVVEVAVAAVEVLDVSETLRVGAPVP
jgi:hypothetical protein